MKTIKQLFATALLATGIVIALLFMAIWRVGAATDTLTQAQSARFLSALCPLGSDGLTP